MTLDRDIRSLAAEFARNAHAGQIHRDGQPAIVHSLGVAENFMEEPEVYAIAVLHDVLEDCPEITYDHIVDEFGTFIAVGVLALTRAKDESWSHYIARVRQNPDAVRIKIADIQYNIGRADEKFLRKLGMYTDTLAQLQESQLQFISRPCQI